MTEKRARTPLSKVRSLTFEREYTPVKPVRARVRFKTVDDVVFEVCDTSIVPSIYMNRLVYSSRVNRQQSSEVTHPLPNVAADVFENVMRYCYFHTSRYCDSLLPNQVKEWDDQFMDLDPRQLCELASAAYYLDVKDLIELTCRAIASIISGKTAEQIRKTFHIENDLAGSIDRVLPTSTRRRGREHSPKESSRNRDVNDNSSQERNENNVQQENPGAEKSIEEIAEWINGSSSKPKKKKKKRHKDKNPARKGNELSGNDDEVCDSEAVRTASTAVQVPDASAGEEGPLSRGQESTTAAGESIHGHRDVKDRGLLKESERIASHHRQLEEMRPSIEPDQDNASSSSDIALVSVKLVNPVPVKERRGASQNTNVLKASSSSQTPDQHISTLRSGQPDQSEAFINSTSDTDSVQWVPLKSGSQRGSAKEEVGPSESSSDAGESSESDAGTTPPQEEPSNVETEEDGKGPVSERGVPSHVNTRERKSDLAVELPRKEDIAMVDVPQNPTSFPVLRDEHATEQPFIDCPENMDREVEAFQKRLIITEPLSSHRNTPQMRNTAPTITERESRSMPTSVNADGQWRANGVMTESHVPRPRGRPGSSHERTVINVSQEAREETRPGGEHSALLKHSSIPKEVLAKLLRISSEKEECQKIAAAIDAETARLGAKREIVRDNLAVLIMEERELRLKYKVPDKFP